MEFDHDSAPECWPEVAEAFQQSLLKVCTSTLQSITVGEDVQKIDADANGSDADWSLWPWSNDAGQLEDEEQQNEFLKPGSMFQNPYMSLWSRRGTPVSVTLSFLDDNRLRLRCENLDSVMGGSSGWIEFMGSFELQRVPGSTDRDRLLMAPIPGVESFKYDPALFKCKANFGLSCLKRIGSAALGAVRFEVDTSQQQVFVEPTVSVLRWFWDAPVKLERTSSKQMWIHEVQHTANGHAQQQRQGAMQASCMRPVAAFA